MIDIEHRVNDYIRNVGDPPLPPQLRYGAAESLEGNLRIRKFSNDSQDLGKVAAEAVIRWLRS